MQNYSTTTEQTKSSMKIQTTVTVHDTVELDIELPYYCKTADAFIKVVAEDKAVRVSSFGTLIMITDPSFDHNAKEIASAVVATEDQFNQAYENALSNIKALAQ
jgi:hypothetical protein